MRTIRGWWPLLLAGLLAVPAGAQDMSQYGDQEPPPRERRHEPPVLFLTPQIIDLAIDRLTEQMAEHYEFDEDQLWNTRQLVKERFPQFVNQHRDELVTIVNQYAAALLGEDPPLPEEVAEWSERAQPLLNEFAGLIEETTAEMQPFLTEQQQVRINAAMAMFRVGISHVNQRMEVWRSGGYDWEAEWPRSEAFREKQRAREAAVRREQEQARNEVLGIAPAPAAPSTSAASQPAGKPTEPKDEWTMYVEGFIKRYDLNEEQQGQARKILHALQEQRDSYLRRKLPAIEDLQERQKKAATDEERAKVRTESERLNEPLDRYFQQLKDRLETLPTRRQRAAAARTELETRVKAEPKAEAKQH